MRNFALWAGCAALVAVVVAGITVAAFPHESSSVQLAPIRVPARPALRPARALSVETGQIGRTTRAILDRSRGGAATPTTASTHSGATGFGSATASSQARSTAHPPAAGRVVKRQTSIGAVSGPNGDSGLAGAGSLSIAVVGGSASRVSPRPAAG